MNGKLFSALIAVAVAAMALGGCGDDDGEDSASTVKLSKAEFIAQANQICRRSQGSVTKRFTSYMEKRYEKEETGREREALTSEAIDAVLVPALEVRISELRALGQPQRGQAEMKAYLGTLEEAVEAVKEGKASTLTEVGEVLGNAGAAGTEYGLTYC